MANPIAEMRIVDATSTAASERSPQGPHRAHLVERIASFVFKTAVYTMFAIFGLVILAFFIAPAVQQSGGAPRLECLNNARQIGLALSNYHQAHGSFPPAYVADAQGKPLYSWRVLVLPYLERSSVSEQFHLNEPWDSPHNRQFIKMMPRSFRCPSDPRKKSSFTNFVAITGPGTVFDGTKTCQLTDITDGPDKTLLIVETAESDIVWTEPRDLPLATLNLKIDSDRKGISSHHGQPPSIWNAWASPSPHGANAIFCDGHGRFLSHDFRPETLRALCTINGGERLPDDDF